MNERPRYDPTTSSLNVKGLSERVQGILGDPYGAGKRYMKIRNYHAGSIQYLDIPGEGKFFLKSGLREEFISTLIGSTIKTAGVFTVPDKRGYSLGHTYSPELELDDINDPVHLSQIRGESLVIRLLFNDHEHSVEWKKSREPNEYNNMLAKKVGRKWKHYLYDYSHAAAHFREPYWLDYADIFRNLKKYDRRARGRLLRAAIEKMMRLQATFDGPLGQRHFVAIISKLTKMYEGQVREKYSKLPDYKELSQTKFEEGVFVEAIKWLTNDLNTYWGAIATSVGAKRGITKYYNRWVAHIHDMAAYLKALERANEENANIFRSIDDFLAFSTWGRKQQ